MNLLEFQAEDLWPLPCNVLENIKSECISMGKYRQVIYDIHETKIISKLKLFNQILPSYHVSKPNYRT